MSGVDALWFLFALAIIAGVAVVLFVGWGWLLDHVQARLDRDVDNDDELTR